MDIHPLDSFLYAYFTIHQEHKRMVHQELMSRTDSESLRFDIMKNLAVYGDKDKYSGSTWEHDYGIWEHHGDWDEEDWTEPKYVIKMPAKSLRYM